MGSLVSGGALLSAGGLYLVGRFSKPRHRLAVFGAGLVLFLLGAVANMAFFDAAGVIAFQFCAALARPLLDAAYFPIQMLVIDRLAWWSKSRRHDLVTEPERRDLSVDSRVGTEIAERDYKRSCHFLVVGKPGRVRARLRLPIALGEKERVLAAADGRKAHHIEF